MRMINVFDRLSIVATAGGAGGVLGAITHDQFLTWCGAIAAASSAFISLGLSAYHRLRDAQRTEAAADRAAQLDDIRAMTRVQIELERRIDSTESRLTGLDGQLERVRCRVPNADGTAKCAVQ